MTQRQTFRSRRRGSENRARPHQVPVRLSDDELARLDAEASRRGLSRPEVLRDAFLNRAVVVEEEGPPAAFFDERDLAVIGMYGDDEEEPQP